MVDNAFIAYHSYFTPISSNAKLLQLQQLALFKIYFET